MFLFGRACGFPLPAGCQRALRGLWISAKLALAAQYCGPKLERPGPFLLSCPRSTTGRGCAAHLCVLTPGMLFCISRERVFVPSARREARVGESGTGMFGFLDYCLYETFVLNTCGGSQPAHVFRPCSPGHILTC